MIFWSVSLDGRMQGILTSLQHGVYVLVNDYKECLNYGR